MKTEHNHPHAQRYQPRAYRWEGPGPEEELLDAALEAHNRLLLELVEGNRPFQEADIIEFFALEAELETQSEDVVEAEDIREYSRPNLLDNTRDIVGRLIKQISQAWSPEWAGELVTAADISEQEHIFPMGNGEIKIVCSWRPSYQEIPAFVKIIWNANISTPGELWVRFIRPETDILLAEFRLGAHRSGEAVFSMDDLGFDPSQEKWAIILLLKDIEV